MMFLYISSLFSLYKLGLQVFFDLFNAFIYVYNVLDVGILAILIQYQHCFIVQPDLMQANIYSLSLSNVL